jgi:hypothetical protein
MSTERFRQIELLYHLDLTEQLQIDTHMFVRPYLDLQLSAQMHLVVRLIVHLTCCVQLSGK